MLLCFFFLLFVSCFEEEKRLRRHKHNVGGIDEDDVGENGVLALVRALPDTYEPWASM